MSATKPIAKRFQPSEPRFYVVLLSFIVAVCHAGEPQKVQPIEALKGIQQRHDQARTNLKADWMAFDRKQTELFDEALKLAKGNPSSEAGFKALEWMLLEPRAYSVSVGPPALTLMAEQYATNADVGTVLAVLGYYCPYSDEPSYKPAVALFNAVIEKNRNRTARGHAALALAWIQKLAFTDAEFQHKENAEQLAQESERKFQDVINHYGNCPNLRRTGARPASKTLGEEAATEVFELQKLRVGKLAPEIQGEDLNGTPFKLSDSRGKVVLLVFWASWCGPCMAAIPHENELAQRFKGRPFAVIGVNGDSNRTNATAAVAAKQVAWRSFWNGKDGAGGPIALTWNVRSWPTTYILDDKGVIRFKELNGKGLDNPIEQLVGVAEGR